MAFERLGRGLRTPPGPPRADVTSLGPDRIQVRVRDADGSPQLSLSRVHGKHAVDLPAEPDPTEQPGGASTMVVDLRALPDLGAGRFNVSLRRQSRLLHRVEYAALEAATIDTRALVLQDLGQLSPPFLSAIPHRDGAGLLSLRVWKAAAAHAELEWLRVDRASGRVQVGGTLLGTVPSPREASLLLRSRSEETTVLRRPAQLSSSTSFTSEIELRAFEALGAGALGYWDLFLEMPGASPVRIGRQFDDVVAKKPVFVYPAATVAGPAGTTLRVRPYFTEYNNLSLRITQPASGA